MVYHRTQNRKGCNFLISGSLKKRAATYRRTCLALRNLILDEVSEDIHKIFLKLPEVVSAVKERMVFYLVVNTVD